MQQELDNLIDLIKDEETLFAAKHPVKDIKYDFQDCYLLTEDSLKECLRMICTYDKHHR